MTTLSVSFLVCVMVCSLHNLKASTTTEAPLALSDIFLGDGPQSETDFDEIDLSQIPDEYLIDYLTALDEKFVGDAALADSVVSQVHDRQKRWVPLALRAGLFAIKHGRRMFRGVKFLKKTPSGLRTTRHYGRRGDFRKAVKDFHRLKPTNVERFRGKNGLHGLRGKLGKNTVQVRNKSSSGRPTLEVFRRNKGGRSIHRKVRYDKKN